jgi:hypothetical protein
MFAGDLATAPPSSPVVGMAATADHRGYWLAERNGAVLAFGDARTTAPAAPGPPTVGIAADPITGGFYTVTVTGAVHAFNAPALHSGPLPDGAGPAVGIAAAGASGAGVWVATANGNVFPTGPVPAVRTPAGVSHVTGITGTPSGKGYWLVTTAGAVRAAGDAAALGTAPSEGSPAVGLVAAPDGHGALLIRSDGTVQPLGDAVYLGDARSPLHPPYYPKRYELPPTDAIDGAYLAPGTQPATTGPLRVAFLGDSLSVITGKYTRLYLASHNQSTHAWVANGGILGCGITGALPLAVYSDPGSQPPRPTLPACAQWEQQYGRTLALSHPDVVVLLLGYWESQRHKLSPHGVVTDTTSAAYRNYLAVQLQSVNDLVTAAGARLVVLTAPPYGDGTPLANVAAFNQLLRAQARSSSATVVNLGSLIAPSGQYRAVVDQVRVRTGDRVHLTPMGVERVIDPALVPVILKAAREGRRAHGVVGTPVTQAEAASARKTTNTNTKGTHGVSSADRGDAGSGTSHGR